VPWRSHADGGTGLSGHAGDQRLRRPGPGRVHTGGRDASGRTGAVRSPCVRAGRASGASRAVAAARQAGGRTRQRRRHPGRVDRRAAGAPRRAGGDHGCVTPTPTVTGGRLHERGWASIDLGPQTALYLQRAGQAWEVRAARRAGWEIEYGCGRAGSPSGAAPVDRCGHRPWTPASRSRRSNPMATCRTRRSTSRFPAGVEALTVEELRQAGPLRGQ
jgi:hypothetical protein